MVHRSRHRTPVLVVAARDAVRSALANLIAAQHDMRVCARAASARDALAAAVDERPAVAVVDIELADHDGLWLASRLKRLRRAPRVLLVSAYADVALAPQALLAGADGIINLGVLGDRIAQAVRTVRRGDLDVPGCTGTIGQRAPALSRWYRKRAALPGRGAGRPARIGPHSVAPAGSR